MKNSMVFIVWFGCFSSLAIANGPALNQSLQDTFFEAARTGNTQSVRRCLKQGVPVNGLDRHGVPAIVSAAQEGHFDVVKLLHKKGADICAGREKNGWTALHAAAVHKHNTIVRYLLKKGAQPNQVTRPHKYWPGCAGETALAAAARGGNKEGVALLLDKDADLHKADEWGRTPIYWAAERDHGDIVDYLLMKGASINVTDGVGNSLLHNAAEWGEVDRACFLLSRGVAVDAKNYKGKTPLSTLFSIRQESDFGIYPDDARTALLLLQHDADPKEVGLDDQDIRWWYGDGSLTIRRIRENLSAINANNKSN